MLFSLVEAEFICMGGESWGMVGRIEAVEVGGWGSEDITVVVSAISLGGGSGSWNMVERTGLESDQVKSVEVPTAAQRGSGFSNSEGWSTAASRSAQGKEECYCGEDGR